MATKKVGDQPRIRETMSPKRKGKEKRGERKRRQGRGKRREEGGKIGREESRV